MGSRSIPHSSHHHITPVPRGRPENVGGRFCWIARRFVTFCASPRLGAGKSESRIECVIPSLPVPSEGQRGVRQSSTVGTLLPAHRGFLPRVSGHTSASFWASRQHRSSHKPDVGSGLRWNGWRRWASLRRSTLRVETNHKGQEAPCPPRSDD